MNAQPLQTDNVADSRPVAGLCSWSPKGNQVVKLRTRRGNGSVLETQPCLAHGKFGADVDQIFTEGVNNLFASCLGNLGRRRIVSLRQAR